MWPYMLWLRCSSGPQISGGAQTTCSIGLVAELKLVYMCEQAPGGLEWVTRGEGMGWGSQCTAAAAGPGSWHSSVDRTNCWPRALSVQAGTVTQ